MSDLNTAGLNGKGKAIESVANHALLVLISRFSVPVLGTLLIWQVSEMKAAITANATALGEMSTRMAVMEFQIEQGTADRFTRTDARGQFGVMQERYDGLVARVARLEAHIDQ